MTIVSDHVQIFWLRSGREAICKEMKRWSWGYLRALPQDIVETLKPLKNKEKLIKNG